MKNKEEEKYVKEMDFWKIFFKQTNKMTIFGSLFELPP